MANHTTITPPVRPLKPAHLGQTHRHVLAMVGIWVHDSDYKIGFLPAEEIAQNKILLISSPQKLHECASRSSCFGLLRVRVRVRPRLSRFECGPSELCNKGRGLRSIGLRSIGLRSIGYRSRVQSWRRSPCIMEGFTWKDLASDSFPHRRFEVN
jgi:hypothetical protein